MIELGMEPAEQIPFWMIISKEVAKSKKWVKPIHKMTFGQINEMIMKGKLQCSTCDTMVDITLPKTFEELRDILFHIIDPYCLLGCDKCVLDDFDKGRILVGDEKLLDEIKQIRAKQNMENEKN